MLALCIVAGARTPAFDGPPEIIERLGTTPGVLWDNHTELAYYLQTRGDFAGMEEAARKAIAVDPSQPTGWWYLAVALLQQERLASGVEALREVLRLDPAHGNGRHLWEDLTGQPPPSPLADSTAAGAHSPASPTDGTPP
jgi:tetratricopeptide (TPR) repeat protein